MLPLVSDPRNVTAEQYLIANLRAFNVTLTGPFFTNAIRDANWSKRVGGKAGLRNYVSDLILANRK
jgi:hypothetical protein